MAEFILDAQYRTVMAAGRKNHFKVVLLGEGCVGKTSLVLRYCQDKFNDKHLQTLQVKCFSLVQSFLFSHL